MPAIETAAEIIAVGSELLTPRRIDTNSLFLTAELNALGVEVVRKAVIGDDRERLTSAIAEALRRTAIVIITGGLGPTEDDLTRDATAAATGRELEFRQEILDTIAARFRTINRPMAAVNRRQAFLVSGAEILPNARGTAPGQWLSHQGATVILLPGPPRELESMFREQCVPRLRALLPPRIIRTRVYRVANMPESDLDQLIAPVYTKYSNPATTILAHFGDIQIHLRALCNSEGEAEQLLAEVGGPIESLLGNRIYSCSGDPLELVIGDLLRSRGATLSVAESATGGLLGERITEVPGSSDYFRGGFLVYTDQMKERLLGVPPSLLEQHSPVSEPVARVMAEAARERTGSDYALSVTGYAGPGGDNPGRIFVGFASPDGSDVLALQFGGERSRVRALAAQSALDLLRRKLL